MGKTTTALETPLRDQLDRLAAFEPSEFPVVSLYIDMRADQTGRPAYDSFLRKAFSERLRTLSGPARDSFERDVARVTSYLADDVKKSAQTLALFVCAGQDDFFEALQLQPPIERHLLFVAPVPHLYPLARLNDQFPRYAALLLDTNSARLFVFGLGTTESATDITNTKTRKTTMGGWSQARYQRHVENFHLHHMKEVVEVLERVVREEALNHIVLVCEDSARPTLMEQMPSHLASKVVDHIRLDMKAPEHEVLAATLDALREKDADADRDHVTRMLDAWRASGLAVVGSDATLQALAMGQVEELLIAASPNGLAAPHKGVAGDRQEPLAVDSSAAIADELVAKAQQTSARIRFIEDASLLNEVGGVGALLRYRL